MFCFGFFVGVIISVCCVWCLLTSALDVPEGVIGHCSVTGALIGSFEMCFRKQSG